MTSKRREPSSDETLRFRVSISERLDRLIFQAMQSKAEEWGREAPTRSQVSNWIASGLVKVDGQIAEKAGSNPKAGAEIEVQVPQPREMHILPDSSVDIAVLHEEGSFLVVNKPPGLVMHPGAGRDSKTLVHGLLHHLGENIEAIGDAYRPGVVHRLDKDTSGLLVVAKTEASFRNLTKQLRPPRTMDRRYLLLCATTPKAGPESVIEKDGQSGVLSHQIARSTSHRTKMATVKSGGREAKTHWKVIEAFPNAVLIEAKLETGRTHQIRVHFQAAGAPLLGDPVYGNPRRKMPRGIEQAVDELRRQALHAAQLSFLHPESGKRVEFSAELPEDMQRLIHALRKGE